MLSRLNNLALCGLFIESARLPGEGVSLFVGLWGNQCNASSFDHFNISSEKKGKKPLQLLLLPIGKVKNPTPNNNTSLKIYQFLPFQTIIVYLVTLQMMHHSNPPHDHKLQDMLPDPFFSAGKDTLGCDADSRSADSAAIFTRVISPSADHLCFSPYLNIVSTMLL